MRTLFWRCPACYRYTLESICPACTRETRSPLPPRYSPQDHYGRYRRALQRQVRQDAGPAPTATHEVDAQLTDQTTEH